MPEESVPAPPPPPDGDGQGRSLVAQPGWDKELSTPNYEIFIGVGIFGTFTGYLANFFIAPSRARAAAGVAGE